MYLSNITGNVLNKFNQQPINILYEPQYNLFDILLAECELNLFAGKSDRFVNMESSQFTFLTEHQVDLFNYNVGMTNSIVGYTQHKKYDILHLNTIIFTHSYKPPHIKKEDIVIMKNNTKHTTQVFFDMGTKNSWKLSESVMTNYGIPQNKFYSENKKRNNRVLMFNFDRNPNIATLVQFLEQQNVEVDVVKDISCNIDLMRELLNQYAVCIDLNDYNISNLLVGIACGCKAVTYATPMIMDNYKDTPNLLTATTIQDLIGLIKQAAETETVDHSDYFDKTYNFETFKNTIQNLVSNSNNKAYIL